MLIADSPPKELSMTVIRVVFKTVHEKSSLKGVSLVVGVFLELLLSVVLIPAATC